MIAGRLSEQIARIEDEPRGGFAREIDRQCRLTLPAPADVQDDHCGSNSLIPRKWTNPITAPIGGPNDPRPPNPICARLRSTWRVYGPVENSINFTNLIVFPLDYAGLTVPCPLGAF